MFPVLIQAQTFRHSVFSGPNFSYFTSDDSWIGASGDDLSFEYWGVGFDGGYNLEYHFTKYLIIGSSIYFSSLNAKFNNHCYCVHTYDHTVYIKNSVSTHNIDIPLFFKLKTNKSNYTFFLGGFGLNWLFSAYRKVDFVRDYLGKEEQYFTKLVGEKIILQNRSNNQFGTFYQIGVGQKFQVKKIKFFTELSFRQDISSWIYKTFETPEGIKEFPIKRQSISLKLGVFMKN